MKFLRSLGLGLISELPTPHIKIAQNRPYILGDKFDVRVRGGGCSMLV